MNQTEEDVIVLNVSTDTSGKTVVVTNQASQNVIVVSPVAASIAAAGGGGGGTGPQGPAGDSAYDIWISEGNTGTEADFLASLVGQDGQDGADGAPGADGAEGPAGPQGPAGANGVDGQNGADGAEGPQGPAGTNGVDGADGTIGSITYGSAPTTVTSPNTLTFEDLFGGSDDGSGNVTINQEKFSQNYTANMPDDPTTGLKKTFGKYKNGDPIPASGKTAIELLIDAFTDSVDPSASFSNISTPAYGQGNFSDTISVDFGIQNNSTVSGTTGVSALLEWGVNGYGTGSGGGQISYTNTQVYYNAPIQTPTLTFFTSYSSSNVYRIRLTVTEAGTNGDTITSSKSNTSGSNNWTSDLFGISRASNTSGLDNLSDNAVSENSTTRRVRGNTESDLSISFSSKSSSYVDISTVSVYGDVGTGTPTTLLTTFTPNSGTVSQSYNHDPGGNPQYYNYRVVATDEYGFTASETIQITYYYESYYGTDSASSWSSSLTSSLTTDLVLSVPGNLDGLGPFSNQSDSPATFVWIAYPSTTDITTIDDGAEIITTGFVQQSDETITNLNGVTGTYSVYRSFASNSFDNVTINIT